ncbi:hypothetical protein GP486_005270 [Trichoglossum hirsutum]|uniref:Uncharacterized protein n=1 Tax=Trichoglossum hirsutum TaxID=265104 RepID=A0A9P8L9E2_9PEZI|nr:hypothetical protein GP486_005270 [Trichoglossum hirsutum]
MEASLMEAESCGVESKDDDMGISIDDIGISIDDIGIDDDTEILRLSWAACCNAKGKLFAVSLGDGASGFDYLLSNHEGDPLVISHDNSVYVLRMISSIRGAVFDGLSQCQIVGTVSSVVIRVGSRNVTISKSDISDTSTLVDLERISKIYVDRRPECRYINLVIKAQPIEKIWTTECFGLETLR